MKMRKKIVSRGMSWRRSLLRHRPRKVRVCVCVCGDEREHVTEVKFVCHSDIMVCIYIYIYIFSIVMNVAINLTDE